MSNSSMGKRTLRIFLKTVGVILAFVVVGVASYALTMLYYNITSRTERAKTYDHVIEVKTGPQSVNLIYAYNKSNNKIEKIVLEIFDTDTKNLDYITIPAATEVETSPELYAELMKASTEVPQIVRLSKLNSYFKGDVAYEYGIKVLDEALGVNIGYFTAMDTDKFNEWFTNRGESDASKYAPSDKLFSDLSSVKSESDMSSFIDDAWKSIISDITLVQKEKYASSLVQVNKDLIHVFRAYCTKVKDTYTLDKEKTGKLIEKLLDNEEYKTAQTKQDTEPSKSSTAGSTSTDTKKLKIRISNASNIQGLAAKFKEKLQSAGYNITEIGNYDGSVSVETKILVSEDGIGKDLLSYFTSASIEVSDHIAAGADIEIVIGTEDRSSAY